MSKLPYLIHFVLSVAEGLFVWFESGQPWLMVLHPLYPDIVSCTTSPISARHRLRAVANCNNQHLGSKILEIENEYHYLTLAVTTSCWLVKRLSIQNLKHTAVRLNPNRPAVTFVWRVLVFCICCCSHRSCVWYFLRLPHCLPASSHCPGARCAPGAGAGAFPSFTGIWGPLAPVTRVPSIPAHRHQPRLAFSQHL